MTDRNFRYDPDLGGVLRFVILTGTCGPIGYGFQGALSGTGYLHCISSLSVLNRVFLHDLMA